MRIRPSVLVFHPTTTKPDVMIATMIKIHVVIGEANSIAVLSFLASFLSEAKSATEQYIPVDASSELE